MPFPCSSAVYPFPVFLVGPPVCSLSGCGIRFPSCDQSTCIPATHPLLKLLQYLQCTPALRPIAQLSNVVHRPSVVSVCLPRPVFASLPSSQLLLSLCSRRSTIILAQLSKSPSEQLVNKSTFELSLAVCLSPAFGSRLSETLQTKLEFEHSSWLDRQDTLVQQLQLGLLLGA